MRRILVMEVKKMVKEHKTNYLGMISLINCIVYLLINTFLRFYLFIFRNRGREGERERNFSVWLPLIHSPLETWPATQACALTGNRTNYSLVHRLVLNPLDLYRPGSTYNFRYFIRNIPEHTQCICILCPADFSTNELRWFNYNCYLKYFTCWMCIIDLHKSKEGLK